MRRGREERRRRRREEGKTEGGGGGRREAYEDDVDEAARDAAFRSEEIVEAVGDLSQVPICDVACVVV